MHINGKWHGFDSAELDFEGRKAVVVFPEAADEKKNWTIKTEYWGAFPETEMALLRAGFHVTYLENKTRFATLEDCDAKARFAAFLASELGLRDKCVPIGMSCGGAHAVNFAGYHPERVLCMFIDAPVLNFCDYPGRYGDCEGVWEREFIKAYPGIKRAELMSFEYHPINRIPVLKEHKIPIIMAYGTEDMTVNYNKNGRLLAEAYEDSPALLTVLPRSLQGHHPHGFPSTPQKITDIIISYAK